MNRWLKKIDALNQRVTFWSVVVSATLLAGWMQYIQHGWINPDTVLYFEHARLISLGDWRGAMAVYPWPFYGACIALVHALGFSIHLSAQILNMIFFGMAMAGFTKIINLAGGSNRAVFAGALLVFGSQYIVGDVLEMLMRDEGFWAFYLFAIFFFTQFFLLQKTKDAILWQIFIGIATLFRIESLMYAAFLPFTWLVRYDVSIKVRIQKLLVSYSVSIFLLSTLLMMITVSDQLNMQDFGRLNEIFTSNLLVDFTNKLTTHADAMSKLVLKKYLEEYAIEGLLVTFLYILIVKTITTTGTIGIVLAYLGMRFHLRLTLKPVYIVLSAVLLISILSMYFTIIKVFVLSSRYVVPAAWVLLIFAALYWGSIIQKKPKLWAHTIIILVLLLGFTKNILPKRDGYNYQQDAVAWLLRYNKTKKSVFYEDARLGYYAGAPFAGTDTYDQKLDPNYGTDSIKNYEFLVFHGSSVAGINGALRNEIDTQFHVIKKFNSPQSKKSVVIFQRH